MCWEARLLNNSYAIWNVLCGALKTQMFFYHRYKLGLTKYAKNFDIKCFPCRLLSSCLFGPFALQFLPWWPWVSNDMRIQGHTKKKIQSRRLDNLIQWGLNCCNLYKEHWRRLSLLIIRLSLYLSDISKNRWWVHWGCSKPIIKLMALFQTSFKIVLLATKKDRDYWCSQASESSIVVIEDCYNGLVIS